MTDNFKRPTPTVDYEALPLALEDVLYSGSDKDESIKEQQTRRRRIGSKHIIVFKVLGSSFFRRIFVGPLPMDG